MAIFWSRDMNFKRFLKGHKNGHTIFLIFFLQVNVLRMQKNEKNKKSQKVLIQQGVKVGGLKNYT